MGTIKESREVDCVCYYFCSVDAQGLDMLSSLSNVKRVARRQMISETDA
jgi:hypothetical protein